MTTSANKSLYEMYTVQSNKGLVVINIASVASATSRSDVDESGQLGANSRHGVMHRQAPHVCATMPFCKPYTNTRRLEGNDFVTIIINNDYNYTPYVV